jgi:hypothetical protein
VVVKEVAELTVSTVESRAHGSDPSTYEASDLPVRVALDIREVHDGAKVVADTSVTSVLIASAQSVFVPCWCIKCHVWPGEPTSYDLEDFPRVVPLARCRTDRPGQLL